MVSSVEVKARFLLDQSSKMKRTEMIACLKRYRGWELAEIANYFGCDCNKGAAKVVYLQIVLQHLLSHADEYKISV